MKYIFIPMTKEFAIDIAYNWKYDKMYSFYDMTEDEDDLKEFLKQENWGNSIFAVGNRNNELVGFFSYYFIDEVMWIGFGLRPDLTGKGFGFDFVKEGIIFGLKKFKYDKDYIMIAIPEFNKRAMNLFKKLGFKEEEKYLQYANNNKYIFIKMKKRLK